MKKRKPAPKPIPGPGMRARPQPAPDFNYDSAMASQMYQNLMDYQMQNFAAQNATTSATAGLAATLAGAAQRQNPGDFVDTRLPGKNYAQDMIDYIDPSTGEITSRTRGVAPGPNSRFIPIRQYTPMDNQQQNVPLQRIAIERPNLSPESQARQALQRNLAQLQAKYNMLPSQNQQQNVPTPMPIQTPQSAAANQALSQAGLGGGIPSPVQQGTAQQQQAMQNYQNLLSQGAANYQAAMQQPISPAMRGPTPTQRKPSTSSFQTPRPFG